MGMAGIENGDIIQLFIAGIIGILLTTKKTFVLKLFPTLIYFIIFAFFPILYKGARLPFLQNTGVSIYVLTGISFVLLIIVVSVLIYMYFQLKKESLNDLMILNIDSPNAILESVIEALKIESIDCTKEDSAIILSDSESIIKSRYLKKINSTRVSFINNISDSDHHVIEKSIRVSLRSNTTEKISRNGLLFILLFLAFLLYKQIIRYI